MKSTKCFSPLLTAEVSLAVIEQNGKYGFIDRTGTIVISTQYDDAHSFKNNQAKVKLDDETFYIDKTGKHIQ